MPAPDALAAIHLELIEVIDYYADVKTQTQGALALMSSRMGEYWHTCLQGVEDQRIMGWFISYSSDLADKLELAGERFDRVQKLVTAKQNAAAKGGAA